MTERDDDIDTWLAMRRVPERFYVTRRFREGGKDAAPGAPWCRFAYQVCDTNGDVVFDSENGWELTIRETPTRQQLRALFFEDTRSIGHLRFQRFRNDGRSIKGETFTLTGQEITDFAAFLALISSSAQFVESNAGVRLGQNAVHELLKQEELRHQVYEDYRPAILELVEADIRAPEITALARRRHQIDEFERLLTDPAHFEGCRRNLGDGKPAQAEKVWQQFFEQNRWIFGSGLAVQFLHAWNPERLEQVVVGASAFGPGKRADGLMRTGGALSALVFVEIKKHSTDLVHPSSYRSGVWRIDDEVAGGVAQCQAEVDMTVASLGQRVERETKDGWETGEWTNICRPRSVLVVGSLDQFKDADGKHNLAQFRSFERFRRSLTDPEIITFDELYDRARMVVTMSEATDT